MSQRGLLERSGAASSAAGSGWVSWSWQASALCSQALLHLTVCRGLSQQEFSTPGGDPVPPLTPNFQRPLAYKPERTHTRHAVDNGTTLIKTPSIIPVGRMFTDSVCMRFQDRARGEVEGALQRCASLPEKLCQLLSGQQLSAAVALASCTGDVRLASLISQVLEP